MEILSNKQLEEMTPNEKQVYYKEIKNYCKNIKDYQSKFGQQLIYKVYPHLRKYNLEIEGEENIPKDHQAMFICNHCNSHDIFTAYETLAALNRKASVMVATDCLSPLSKGIFNVSNATLLDRNKSEDRNSAIINMSGKILKGYDGFIFGEGTWNLHPEKPMQNIRTGGVKIASITEIPIIPVNFEYIENEGIFEKDDELFSKCVVRFAKPIDVTYNKDLISQTKSVQKCMIENRLRVWEEYGIKHKIDGPESIMNYLNHTYVKKFGALGFTFDSKSEEKFLLFLENELRANEYTLDKDGKKLVPGVTEKNSEIKTQFMKK